MKALHPVLLVLSLTGLPTALSVQEARAADIISNSDSSDDNGNDFVLPTSTDGGSTPVDLNTAVDFTVPAADPDDAPTPVFELQSPFVGNPLDGDDSENDADSGSATINEQSSSGRRGGALSWPLLLTLLLLVSAGVYGRHKRQLVSV